MRRVKALRSRVEGTAPMSAATEPEQLPEPPDEDEGPYAKLPEDIKEWIDDHRRDT